MPDDPLDHAAPSADFTPISVKHAVGGSFPAMMAGPGVVIGSADAGGRYRSPRASAPRLTSSR